MKTVYVKKNQSNNGHLSQMWLCKNFRHHEVQEYASETESQMQVWRSFWVYPRISKALPKKSGTTR